MKHEMNVKCFVLDPGSDKKYHGCELHIFLAAYQYNVDFVVCTEGNSCFRISSLSVSESGLACSFRFPFESPIAVLYLMAPGSRGGMNHWIPLRKIHSKVMKFKTKCQELTFGLESHDS